MAESDCETKKVPNEGASKNDPGKNTECASKTSEKGESLEDLLTTLGNQINSSDWLQLNTPEKFAAENPEVARAFREASSRFAQEQKGEVKDDGV